MNKKFSTCGGVMHPSINMFMSAAKAFYLEFDSFLESAASLYRGGNYLVDKIRSFLQLFEGFATDVTVLFAGRVLFSMVASIYFRMLDKESKKSCFKVLLYY